jgi:hypothetical protein
MYRVIILCDNYLLPRHVGLWQWEVTNYICQIKYGLCSLFVLNISERSIEKL